MHEHTPMKHGALSICVELFSVSLAYATFEKKSKATKLIYAEQGFYLVGGYRTESRLAGTNELLDKFSSYLETIR
jgi:hypothetical protein